MGIDLLERAAEARGRLLRAEQLVSADAASDPSHGAGYLLTFDIGRILVAADRTGGRLIVRHVETAAELEAIKLAPLDEEEPWWRVTGNPITAAWPGGAGEGAASGAAEVAEVRMQFREDAENPKVISLRYDAGAVRAGEEVTHGR